MKKHFLLYQFQNIWEYIWFKSVIEEKWIEFLSNPKVIVIYIELILIKLIGWEFQSKFSFKIKYFGDINLF